MRKKKIGLPRGVKLFVEDENELMAKVRRGTYKDFTDAVRKTVSIQLTGERLAQFGDDPVSAQFKKQQLQILEPMDKNLTKIVSEMQKMREELTEARQLNRDLVESIRDLKTEAAPDDFVRGKLLKLEKMFSDFRELILNLKQDNLIVRGILLFFTLGYSAGRIKPTKTADEREFLLVIESAGKDILASYREQMESGIDKIAEEVMVRNYAQAIVTKLFRLGEENSQNKITSP